MEFGGQGGNARTGLALVAGLIVELKRGGVLTATSLVNIKAFASTQVTGVGVDDGEARKIIDKVMNEVRDA